ncbi:hypothetical protein LTR08_005466 [Meristemomyces frigidus]|nr:hypothetical protein LTR08_005466 [Meristemomyces frigidus]
MSRPTVADLTGDHSLAQLARRHWLTNAPSKVLPEAVTALWEAVESDAAAPFCLLLLEQLQTLERYLWPGYSDDSSNQHVLLLVLLVNVKRQEQLPVWTLFAAQPDPFASFFKRVTHLALDLSLSTRLRRHLLAFLVAAFQSLDSGLVRRECAPLVSIATWHNLHSYAAKERQLAKGAQVQKAWRAAGKKFDHADAAGQARLRFERSWLYSLVLDFLDKLYDADASAAKKQEDVLYCERFLELLCDLLSQLPTRRYVNTLLLDLNVVAAVKLSPLYQDGDDSALLRDMHQLLEHYTYFPIDDQNGKQLSSEEYDGAHNTRIARLQNVALQLQPEKLKILVLANYGSLAQRDELLGHVKALDDAELLPLCSHLGLRTTYPDKSQILQDRAFLDEILASTIESKPIYTDRVRATSTLPTESALYDPSALRTDTYDGTRPLPLPKVNLQYLTLGDFLHRSFVLFRSEACYEIRRHVKDTLKRVQPRLGGGVMRFDGFSKLAVPIGKVAVIETSAARVGEVVPAEVKGEVILDVGGLLPGVRREWEGLRGGEVVFLVSVVQGRDVGEKVVNGGSGLLSAAEQAGVKALRCAEVISVLDDNGRVLRRDQDKQDHGDRPRQRRLLLRLDATAYHADKKRADAGAADVYDSINLIIRRRARENNFRATLESLKQLTLSSASDVPIPAWLRDVFLGYGDPAAASQQQRRVGKVDYGGTFLDWQHLIESLPDKRVEPDPAIDASFPPPYVLESRAAQAAGEVVPTALAKVSRKRRRDQGEGLDAAPAAETVRVTTYQPPNNGPYPADTAKTNAVRFTPAQVSAIASGTQPGLTVIVGPPGTGKTDVTVQIIANIYRNWPQERTLLIAHSNQALNQLFAKLVGGEVEARHLLRLGHGEEELATEARFGKAGRVESFLERGAVLLGKVQVLAQGLGVLGMHGGSCEAAGYFYAVHVLPRWAAFWKAVGEEEGGADVVALFPFHAYFADAAEILWPAGASREVLVEAARGCERHLRRVFEELEEIRPFELLGGQRDKADYLLVKEARVVAMTSTHAAMRRREIAGLGFRYENVVMEEAAQVTEAEAFIPLVMQDSPLRQSGGGEGGGGGLKRVVLVGDHLQNAPVVQHAAFRAYANLEQSLFQRLVRLGVPHTVLDAQGRARPSLAALLQWRYPLLTNLPLTTAKPEFVRANAGFRWEYQFVDVGEYKGRGETEPSPHFVQNLGEAEYAVALFQYMRLLGYPGERITILAAYAGQRALIADVLKHRCQGPQQERLFGAPGWLGTVDKYQGEQNDYVILSLVRTKAPGYLRDLRRLTVALSRARLGLYVLGRREVFESSLEVREAFGGLLARGGRLALVTGEMFPAGRGVGEEVGQVVMEGVEHLGEYVYEMTQAKVKALREGGGVLGPLAVMGGGGGGEDEEEAEEEAAGEMDEEGMEGVA